MTEEEEETGIGVGVGLVTKGFDEKEEEMVSTEISEVAEVVESLLSVLD